MANRHPRSRQQSSSHAILALKRFLWRRAIVLSSKPEDYVGDELPQVPGLWWSAADPGVRLDRMDAPMGGWGKHDSGGQGSVQKSWPGGGSTNLKYHYVRKYSMNTSNIFSTLLFFLIWVLFLSEDHPSMFYDTGELRPFCTAHILSLFHISESL